MKQYYMDEFHSCENYQKFISYMLNKSDFFSLVYFKYRENEKMKKSTRLLHDQLKTYKVKSFFTNMWPNMFNLNQSESIYKLVLYRCDPKAIDILSTPGGIFNWQYPSQPMDLCFYRNDYCWFSSSAHERLALLYTNNEQEIKDINSYNTTLSFDREIDSKKLFLLTDLQSGFVEKPYWER